MSSPSCDGDAVTLQALCDALKITVRVVKPVDAEAYDHNRQKKRLLASRYKSMATSRSSSVSLSSDDTPTQSDDEDSRSCVSSESLSSLTFCADYSQTSVCSSFSWTKNVLSSNNYLLSRSKTTPRKGNQKRLSISHEIRPRSLTCIDSRIRDVQNIVSGRLIWLSHIGNEAHYRYLRLKAPDNRSNCMMKVDEAIVASQSRRQRCDMLRSCSSDKDGYFRQVSPQFSASNVHNENTKDLSFLRCGLCLESFTNGENRSKASPSSCQHEFCVSCLLQWSSRSRCCPSCNSSFCDIIDCTTGKSCEKFLCHMKYLNSC